MSEGQIFVEKLSVNSTVPNPIESDKGADNRDPNKGGLTLLTGNTATFSLNGENTYTGKTIINSGTLQLNGSVITPVTLYNGLFTGNATLKMNEAIDKTGNLTVHGGVVAPTGLNYGTITVGNNLEFTDGTFLIKGFDSLRNSDFLEVKGTGTLAGTVTAENAIGNFLRGQTIPILEAKGGVAGRFETVSLPLERMVFLSLMFNTLVLLLKSSC